VAAALVAGVAAGQGADLGGLGRDEGAGRAEAADLEHRDLGRAGKAAAAEQPAWFADLVEQVQGIGVDAIDEALREQAPARVVRVEPAAADAAQDRAILGAGGRADGAERFAAVFAEQQPGIAEAAAIEAEHDLADRIAERAGTAGHAVPGEAPEWRAPTAGVGCRRRCRGQIPGRLAVGLEGVPRQHPGAVGLGEKDTVAIAIGVEPGVGRGLRDRAAADQAGAEGEAHRGAAGIDRGEVPAPRTQGRRGEGDGLVAAGMDRGALGVAARRCRGEHRRRRWRRGTGQIQVDIAAAAGAADGQAGGIRRHVDHDAFVRLR